MTIDSWGGALLFVAFMAEMRHPMDFWKGMLCAQVFIGVVYIFFGAFVSYLPKTLCDTRKEKIWLTFAPIRSTTSMANTLHPTSETSFCHSPCKQLTMFWV